MKTYNLKTHEVTAVQWDADNTEAIAEFLGKSAIYPFAYASGDNKVEGFVVDLDGKPSVVQLTDYIVNHEGNLSVVSADVFEASYEAKE